MERDDPMNRKRPLPILTALGAADFLVFGSWSFLDPRSFFEQLAHFAPYNVHFLHDVGAFQVGIGATLAIALWRRTDAIFAALGGAGVGAAFHVAAHIRDHDLGGGVRDTMGLAVVAALPLIGAAWKLAPERT